MTYKNRYKNRYMNRYIHTFAFMLAALLADGTATAQAQSAGVVVHGNVYGGGNLAKVQTNTEVNMSTGHVEGNVYGGGRGQADNFTCDKAMVGTEVDANACAEPGDNDHKDLGTKVTISNGTVGTLVGEGESQTLKAGTGNVYGGGEIGRVEWNTQVKIGVGTGEGTFAPVIYGNVFGAGKGLATHGYSALVRGNSTVTIQGGAKIGYNVYGGGENSTVGRYWVKGIPTTPCDEETQPTAPTDLPDGMPYQQRRGGICKVTIQGNAEIGYLGIDDKGHVFGAGKGVEPHYSPYNAEDLKNSSRRMADTDEWVYFTDDTEEVEKALRKTGKEKYLQFLQTLSLVTNSYVTIDGSAKVKGSVFGGSESGFVQHDANVTIQGSCEIGTDKYGNIFGGGKGLEYFAEAGKVKGNTKVTISSGTVKGNVYGGGRLGDVGTIDKTNKNEKGELTYNYFWKQNDGTAANVGEHNTNATAANTGICTVSITGGTIGLESTNEPTKHGNVFGAGRGLDDTWWCEKAIAYATSVAISNTAVVKGNAYGGGQIGRVEDDAKVVIGTADGADAPDIRGSVFGAGAGLQTHGYSALVRGNAAVTVQGKAKVGGSVYGGGETASVGRFTVVGGLPKHPDSGGYCTVTIKDNAKIGTSGTGHNVYGACKGVTPEYVASSENRSKSMQLYTNRPDDTNLWAHYNNDESSPFIWRYYASEDDYKDFLQTLALTSHPTVTIDESATVYGSVYGGGERGLTLGDVAVNIQGGTIEQDVYGGGALANSNAGNWDADGYTEVTGLTANESSVTGLYTLSETTYTKITDEAATADGVTTYYSKGKWKDDDLYTTTVNLLGGLIKGDAYGGGLGQKNGFNGATSDIAATVYGDINVTLNGTKFNIDYDTTTDPETDDEGNILKDENDNTVYVKVVKSGRVFGCNNLLGSPQGNVTVTVEKTVEGNTPRTLYKEETIDEETKITDKRKSTTDSDHSYELAAVYGGGNLAPYTSEGKKAHVIINGCEDISIQTVYGGGNAAAVPETDVDIISCFEIGNVFGGGNGHDKYKKGNIWEINPGADVNGQTNTIIYGGTVHEAYGASNEKGIIYGDVVIDVSNVLPTGGTSTCPLDVTKLVGAGKNADVNGDLIIIMGCKPDVKIPEVYGGADNANVNGDVELTITSGWFGKVFGGNNENGAIMGHIKLNIEETGTCSTPIKIEELYLGGNKAAYSQYGYYKYGENSVTGKPILKPRTAEMADADPNTEGYKPAITNSEYGADIRKTAPYDAPELNIISCTYIGKVFGGGLGETAIIYGNPTVNINMIPGAFANDNDKGVPAKMIELGLDADNNPNNLGIIGDVFGGGNAAAVYGNTTVNIGTAEKVQMTSVKDPETDELLTEQPEHTVTGAYISGNVYGGGKLADVGKTHLAKDNGKDIDVIDLKGSTFVNIGAVKGAEILDDLNNPTGRYNYTSVSFTPTDAPGIFIGGNVYGGGMGEAAEPEGTNALTGAFRCGKAMVTGATNVAIGNGTVNGTVYGGGEVGRVEGNTSVTIGMGKGAATGGTSTPVIMHDVYGAGKGVMTHGYSALVRGHAYVNVAGNAQVRHSVYGGGEIASVGRYNIADAAYHAQHPEVEVGMPYSLKDQGSGYCYVNVGGYAEIGEDDMSMTKAGGPDDFGYIFGAGKGILPYEGYNSSETPWRVHPSDIKEEYTSEKENDYLLFIESLALATQTYVTVGGHAFVKGSVYGGSENGHVQHDTDVRIQDNCQIGNGWDATKNEGAGGGVNARYDEALFINPATATPDQINTSAETLKECSSWVFGKDTNSDDKADTFEPYDKHGAAGGGATTASDGHTFYGNVFGGGSGLYAFDRQNRISGKDNHEWLRSAGRVYGNTNVTITGGHILTSVYGGCELTDVGNGRSIEEGKGKCTVKMSGGTLGVPRTLSQIAKHPVTCYLFGAGKGDQRVHFNQWTNVDNVEVEVSGNAIIYGSVFGGGEDGHVLGDTKVTIKENAVIGTWGTSYVDGNIFGAGRGFGGDALTAGVVCGNVDIDIKGGTLLGSVYGGGRLGSVGTYLVPSTHANYGKLIPDGKTITINEDEGTATETDQEGITHGEISISISGGTIGNNIEYAYIAPTVTGDALTTAKTYMPNTDHDGQNRLTHTKGGNVFAGAMGRLNGLAEGTFLEHWPDLGKAKKTTLNISGGTIKSNVYGGGELGTLKQGSTISITGGTIGTEIAESVTTGEGEGATTSDVVHYTFGSVFGGGAGSSAHRNGTLTDNTTVNTDDHAGLVKGSTKITMSAGAVKGSVYGGGELAIVQGSHTTSDSKTVGAEINISGGTIGYNQDGFGGATMGNVYGAGKGSLETQQAGLIKSNTLINISGGTIYHNIYGGGAYGSVGTFTYETPSGSTQPASTPSGCTEGTGTAWINITGGTIGINGHENGMVFGSSRGDVLGNLQRDDYMAWVNEANVTIGTSSATTGPTIAGSVYGSGENGHTLHNTNVAIHSGTIGILTGSPITGSSGTVYYGAEYPYRGNVYGGGCGTDTYTEGGKTRYNPLAGIVMGNATVTMDGGRVARTIYGGGAMGSVGTFTYADATYHTEHSDVPVGKPYSCTEGTGLCTVTISGGSVGPDVLAMPHSYGNVFGAGRGEVHDPTEYTNLETSGYVNKTLVTVSGSAFVRGSVYGGAESGHVLADTDVKIQGGQIGCGKTTTEPYDDNVWAANYTPTDATDLECASWPYKAPYTPYDKFARADGTYPDNSSADNAHPTGTDGHTFYGNVFGGGSGYEPYAAGKWLPTAGWVEGNTTVEITGGHILTSVYGGNEMSDVGQGGVRKMTDLANEKTADMFYDITKPGGKCTVKMSGGTLGVPRTLAQIAAHPVTCYLFGAGKGDQRIFFNKTTNVNNVEVEISGTARIYGSVFGGGEDGHVMRDVKMTIKDNAYIGNYGTSYVEGNVFGGGRGFSGEALTAGNVGGCVNIDIQGGTMLGSVYGGGRLGSVGHGLYLVNEELTIAGKKVKPYGILRPDNQDDRGNTVENFERGNITINISGGTIGNDIEYTYNPTDEDKQKMPNTQFDYQNRVLYTKGGNVFAGCMGRLYSLDGKLLPLWPELGRCKNTVLNITGGHIKSNVYGGAELGVVQEDTKVSITGGTIGTTVGTGDDAYVYGSAFGGGKGSNDAITYPDGTPEANKVSISEAGTVIGNVEVELNKGVAADKKGGIVNKIFGCNDTNGTPKGTVTVHVYATQTPNTDNVNTKQGKDLGKYDVEEVYGGGNMAAYNPDDANSKAATVIIDGCGLTSIETVYGGGNAASVPATEVTVNGTYEIGQAFGGGNGMDKLPTGADNPGANVGYLAYSSDSEKASKAYGTGKAHVTILGGTVHEVYGGSNTKGNVREESRATLKDGEECDFDVTDAYGGGQNALQDGDAILDIDCISGLGKAYGGASNADVNGNVILNITNGTYGQVFGGNDMGGCIRGSITVNVEETGCRPVIIGELYGGGNKAAYSVYGYNDDGTLKTSGDAVKSPEVNVRSFTSIGRIFGGGYGEEATMVGNPTVNINVVEGKYIYDNRTEIGENAKVVGTRVMIGNADGYPIPSHTKGEKGAIQDVFGGGNAAKVIGNPTVNIGTEAGEEVYVEVKVPVNPVPESVENLYTRSGAGTSDSPYAYTKASGTAVAGTTYYLKTAKAVDIRGNVYGGGNNAEVTGDTKVVIGKKAE